MWNNTNNDIIYLKGLLWRLKEWLYVKCLEDSLGTRKHYGSTVITFFLLILPEVSLDIHILDFSYKLTQRTFVVCDFSFPGLDWLYHLVQFSSVAQTLCDPMNRSTPGLPIHHQPPEFTQTHVHRANDAIQPSHPLLSPSPPAPNPSQDQSLFQSVNSSHEVAKVLECQL